MVYTYPRAPRNAFTGGRPTGDMAAERYRTLAGPGEAAFEVRDSRFLGHARPVESVAAAEAFVERVREAHPDATHNVSAYRVRVGGNGDGSSGLLREYASDDGEPGGSAGKPALNVLQGESIENVACVVTRHYGGTNLGVGGLARAYGRAVRAVVEDAGTVEERCHERLHIENGYDDSGTVRGILESAGVAFEATYEERVAFDVRVPAAESEALAERLLSATSGRAEIDTGSVGADDGAG
jgi:uncharacterized YigZ family protein